MLKNSGPNVVRKYEIKWGAVSLVYKRLKTIEIIFVSECQKID